LEELNFSANTNRVFKTTEMINALIEGYQRSGNFDGCWKAYDRLMNSKVLRPNARSFIHILNACGFGSRGEKIPEILRSMREKGVKFNGRVYAALIKAYMMNRNISLGVQTLLEMPKAGIKWEGMHRNALLQGLKKEDYPEEMGELVGSLFAARSERELSGEDTKNLEAVARALKA